MMDSPFLTSAKSLTVFISYDIKLKTILMVIVITAYNLGLTTIFIKYREDRNN